MLDIYLHGFASDGDRFRREWGAAAPEDAVFLEAPEPDPFSGRRRWFPLSGALDVLAREIVHAADLAGRRIAELARDRRATPIRLTGHSQGAMICLELLRRRPPGLERVRCYGGFLPSSLHQPTARVAGPPPELEVYASDGDGYIARAEVDRTIAWFRRHDLIVRDLRSDRLGHGFCADWLDAANFVEVAAA